jgi:hypothetical protein
VVTIQRPLAGEIINGFGQRPNNISHSAGAERRRKAYLI